MRHGAEPVHPPGHTLFSVQDRRIASNLETTSLPMRL